MIQNFITCLNLTFSSNSHTPSAEGHYDGKCTPDEGPTMRHPCRGNYYTSECKIYVGIDAYSEYIPL